MVKKVKVKSSMANRPSHSSVADARQVLISVSKAPSRCRGKFVAPENYSHTQKYGLLTRLLTR